MTLQPVGGSIALSGAPSSFGKARPPGEMLCFVGFQGDETLAASFVLKVDLMVSLPWQDCGDVTQRSKRASRT